ncbi:exocyst complex component EXO70A1-like [Panicum miliaceum]|uniref:Exocyst subunit Exo70 family protein n=1 Tax=Panicum miliaceum TaxID=4540 RepID=A0A3L6SQR0_PANMI|nr:exocyst complex component EXO70A1-like [Panicum miliaceum]
MPVVLAMLERALRAAIGGLIAKFRTDSSPAEGVGVHPLVRLRADPRGFGSLLEDEWAARRRGRLEQHAASYLEASWGPVAACLEAAAGGGGKPARALAKFNAAFEKAHGGQACREVPDPALRAAMRKAVPGMVVPAYSAFLEKPNRCRNCSKEMLRMVENRSLK